MLCKIVLPSNDIFRLPSLPKTYDELFTFIKARFSEASPDNLIIKYMDSDKELISLNNDEDLQTAILTNQLDQMGTLKIFISTKEVSDHHNNTIGSLVKELNPSDKTLYSRKGNADSTDISVFQNQAYGATESLINENSQVAIKADYSMVTGGHWHALNHFIEQSIGHAIEENIKDIVSSLATRFGIQKKIPENVSNIYGKSQKPLEMFCHAPLRNEVIQNLLPSSMCTECKRQIKETEYVCLECSNYKSCEECENRVSHLHPLLKLRASLSDKASQQLSLVKTQPKILSGKKNLFSGKIRFGNSENQVLKLKTLPYQEHQIVLVIKNTGSTFWPKDVKLRCVNGNYRNRQEGLISLDPGSKQVLYLNIDAPGQVGRYLSQWKICYEDEETGSFGESLFIEMHVRYQKEESGAQKRTQLKRQNINIKEKNNVLIKRSEILDDINCERRKNFDEDLDTERRLAEHLNYIFPGCLEEKYEFVKKHSWSKDARDVSKYVEMYIQDITLEKQKCY